MKLRQYEAGDDDYAKDALDHLRQARDILRGLGAKNATNKVRRAIKSAEGAQRHVLRLRDRSPAKVIVNCGCEDDTHVTGWVHSDGPPAIERCDTCKTYPDDDAAKVAHDAECGCDWLTRDHETED